MYLSRTTAFSNSTVIGHEYGVLRVKCNEIFTERDYACVHQLVSEKSDPAHPGTDEDVFL
jgi:hypothetical protein